MEWQNDLLKYASLRPKDYESGPPTFWSLYDFNIAKIILYNYLNPHEL